MVYLIMKRAAHRLRSSAGLKMPIHALCRRGCLISKVGKNELVFDL